MAAAEILYARLSGGYVVVRVPCRGNHLNSVSVQKILELTGSGNECPHYIFDLLDCDSLDSTFMGTMATVGLRQRDMLGSKCTAANVHERVRGQLEMLGLQYLFDIRGQDSDVETGVEGGDPKFSAVPKTDANKLDRIVMMIEAHERLIDVDSQNEIKFRGVLQNLRESLDRATKDR